MMKRDFRLVFTRFGANRNHRPAYRLGDVSRLLPPIPDPLCKSRRDRETHCSTNSNRKRSSDATRACGSLRYLQRPLKEVRACRFLGARHQRPSPEQTLTHLCNLRPQGRRASGEAVRRLFFWWFVRSLMTLQRRARGRFPVLVRSIPAQRSPSLRPPGCRGIQARRSMTICSI